MTIKKESLCRLSFIQVVSIKVEGKKQSRGHGLSFIIEDVSPVLQEAFYFLTELKAGLYVPLCTVHKVYIGETKQLLHSRLTVARPTLVE